LVLGNFRDAANETSVAASSSKMPAQFMVALYPSVRKMFQIHIALPINSHIIKNKYIITATTEIIMSKYLIVGGVAAGMSAAARLRRLDETADIIVFERGSQISYANCGLPYYIGDVIHARDQLLLQTPEGFKQRFNVDVRVQNEVLAVDPPHRVVRVRNLDTGREYEEHYDKLLLAPGGSPLRPPIPGADHPAVHTLWTIPDTDRIRALVDQGNVKTALLIGAGFIGLEMAENLHARGIRVVVVELARQALSPLDYEMAAIIHQELRRQGIELHLEESVTAFEHGLGNNIKVRLTSGGTIGADLVLLSIGVRPNTRFLSGSGIQLGPRGHIVVDPSLRTNVDDIYAAGDAIEVIQPLTGKPAAIPLAGPANKQGRIAAGNLSGKHPRTYDGTLGTAIAKVFDLDVGMTGATEKFCRAEGISHQSVIVHPNDHAGYYPGSTPLSLKLVFSPDTRRVLGAQAVGYAGVDKRIDVIATAIMAGMTVDDLTEIEHAYAPPYSSAKDPVNMAGFVAQNILEELVRTIAWDELPMPDSATHCLLDVRTQDEFAAGTIPGAVNIPLDDLRGRLDELPADSPVIIFCRVGVRGYIAARILMAHGRTDCANLSGGYETWRLATSQQLHAALRPDSHSGDSPLMNPQNQSTNVIKIDACGLQCPGPIMRLKQEMEHLADGATLVITASDPGFYSDAPAWARATGHTLREISLSKGLVTAVIEKGSGTKGANTSGTDKTIVVFSADLDKAIASFIITNGALAMGRKVTLFFTFWGLNVLRKPDKLPGLGKNLVEAAFGWMMPRGSSKLPLSRMNMGGIGSRLIRGIMQHKQVPALEEMMAAAIRNGATLVACQMSMELMGIRREELIDGVQVGGVAAYLEASEHADNNLFI
jgi:NADPH-dependent 2,4-dienoyl-CoA reductase/sulfur reductase-like enzyme/peroxiredoxin family protein/rhodanese-related sulfurtransferase/TusA-related sulfurtransferase